TADVAFTLPVLDKQLTRRVLNKKFNIAEDERFVALSVSQGIIRYSNLDNDRYYQIFAEFCDALVALGKRVILIPHVMERNPNNNDLVACNEVVSRMKTDAYTPI